MSKKPTCTVVAYGKTHGNIDWTHEMEFIHTVVIKPRKGYHDTRRVAQDGTVIIGMERTRP